MDKKNESINNYIGNNKEEEEPLAILNLEIDKGVIKPIKIFKNSNPEEISIKFCKDNNIDLSLMNQIKSEIESFLEKYFLSQQEQNLKSNNALQNDFYEQKNNKNITNNDMNILNEQYNSYQYINQSKNNLSNNYENNKRKLFFYQFLQNKKMSKNHTNKSKSVNKYKTKIFNTINNTKKKQKNKSNFLDDKNFMHLNDSHLTHNYNTINCNKNSNIFDRLYNDAKIKRVVYKRPCHFNSQSKENNIFQDNLNNIYETINGKKIDKNTLNMNPTYIRSYQIKPNQLSNYEYSFKPNIYKYYKTSNNTNNNSYQLNSTHYSNNLPEYRFSNTKNNNFQETIKSNENYKKIINVDSNNYHYNILNFEQNKNNILFEEVYKPLKNKIKRFTNMDNQQNITYSQNMGIANIEPYSNLFNLLINYDPSQILNKNTLNTNNIDNNTLLIISSIIEDINNNEIELNLENFIERLTKDLSNENKQFIIINYSNTSSNNNINNYIFKESAQKSNNKSPSKIKYYGYNTSNKNIYQKYKTSTYFKQSKNFRLPSGTEKKKMFYYL